MIQDFSLYIIGTTATGKTKLSLALASKFGGQIVSADSMQMYKHADILTAKANKEEQAKVNHHMIDIFDLQVINFNRNDYYHLAKRAFDSIHSLNNFPVVVGGTNYYIETLLFKQKIASNRIDLDKPNEFILEQQKKMKELAGDDGDNLLKDNYFSTEEEHNKVQKQLSTMTLPEKYAKLQQLDSILANRLHPNDDRRITSYLSQAMLTGVSPSDQMEDHENIPLRNKNCLIFWPRCSSKEKLENQIQKRIKDMASPEGIMEAFFVFESILPEGTTSEEDPRFLKGVLQSIGYKEFFPFFLFFNSKNFNPVKSSKLYSQEIIKQKYFHFEGEEKINQIRKLMMEDEEGKQVMGSCIKKLAMHTIQYTRRQLKWIRNRILINSDSEEIKSRLFVFQFDEFTSEEFNEKVIEPATQVLQDFFYKSATISQQKPELLSQREQNFIEQLKEGTSGKYVINQNELAEAKKKHLKKGIKEWKNYFCDVCNKDIHGDQNWQIHISSRKHTRAIKSKGKSDERNKQQQDTINLRKQE